MNSYSGIVLQPVEVVSIKIHDNEMWTLFLTLFFFFFFPAREWKGLTL